MAANWRPPTHDYFMKHSRDWVDIGSDASFRPSTLPSVMFQSRDWVDIGSDLRWALVALTDYLVSIPRLG